jgi:hypothetical protein
MDNPNDPDDQVSIDPFPGVKIPEWLVRAVGPRLTRRGQILASVAAVIVIGGVLGGLKLAGVIWTAQPPQWVSALGPGVTVADPEQLAPGHGSPGAAFAGALASMTGKHPAAACGYVYLGPAAHCAVSDDRTPEDQLPYAVSVKTGYVATDGTHALLGYTGEICSPGTLPRCLANADPAAVFSAGRSFGALWTLTVNPSFDVIGSYTLLPCVELGGKWYIGAGPAAGGS